MLIRTVLTAVMAVILPSCAYAHEEECSTIAKLVCGSDDFEILCAASKEAGIGKDFRDGKWTVFAPTDKAFEKLLGHDPIYAIEEMDVHELTNLLLTHVVAHEKILFRNLRCDHRLKMASGEKTRTECTSKGKKKFQYGKDNYKRKAEEPKIIIKDIEACNGIIHVVDDVILPKGFLKYLKKYLKYLYH